MKKILVIIIISLFITAQAEYYPLTTIVTDLDYINNIVTVTDFNGFTWTFQDCEDWQLGDFCALIMDDLDTPLIYDDIIIQIQYSGYAEGWLKIILANY